MIVKISISRLDKELQKGTVAPKDVHPRAGERAAIPGQRGATSRRALRSHLLKTQEPGAEALDRLRQMRGRLLKAQMRRPDAALGLPKGKSVNVIQQAQQSRVPVEALRGYHDAFGPYTMMRNTRQRGEIFMPPEEEFSATVNRNKKLKDAGRLTTLQHELGEFEEMLGKEVTPYSGHMGPRPVIREKLQATGDPLMQRELARLRSGPESAVEDINFERLYKQVGGTPERPVPVGGKQEAALRRLLAEQAGSFEPETKLMALDYATGQHAADRGRYKVPYLPPEIISDYEDLQRQIKPIQEAQASGIRASKAQQPKVIPAASRNMAEQALERKIPARFADYLGATPKQISRMFRYVLK